MAILVDSSASLKSGAWQNVLSFINNFISDLNISPLPSGDRVGLIQFSSLASVILSFNTLRGNQLNVNEIKRYVNSIAMEEGSRRIDVALQLANTDLFNVKGGARPGARRVIVTRNSKIFWLLSEIFWF